MTEKPFRFRYANEIVGSFVLLVLVLLVTGIFIAGRAQGWFERKAVLHTVLTTEKGAFGLREGDEVLIRDTVAGNVGKIVPKEDGTMRTTFNIKYQFLSHLRQGSVAKVRKKFGFAGDSLVEIETGVGDLLKDGDSIECKKDEEFMDTARKALTDVQDVVMPILKELKGVLANLNKITGDIQHGKGLAGTIINDEALAMEMRNVVKNANALMVDTRGTISETRRLIRGVQKHWLWRKYMEKDKQPELLAQIGPDSEDLELDVKHFKSELGLARTSNDPESIAQNSYNLAVCALENGSTPDVFSLIHEARAELAALKKDTLCTYVLEAQAMRKSGKKQEALELAKVAEGKISRSTDKAIELQCRVVLSDLLIDSGDVAGAKTTLKKIESMADKIDSPVVKSMVEGSLARLALVEDNALVAGKRFDNEAAFLRAAGLFEKMAQSLVNAGKAYTKAKDYTNAADRYFRAGRSLVASGNRQSVEDNLKTALEMAKIANDQALITRINEFNSEMAATQ